MRRLLALGFALAAALLLAIFASRTPAPSPADAPGDVFSAQRAMTDVRAIARAPHPTGSEEHARVRTVLLERMRSMSLEVQTQTAALTGDGAARLERWTGEAAAPPVVNLIGVLPGRDRDAPAVVLMSHYDTVMTSPGAADNSTGVAASLEVARAIQVRGLAERDLIILITDAEELNLDGARAFFADHPLAARVGAVVNLEARGGGGRAMMFETGRGAAETIALFGRTIDNPNSNSLASFVYEAMPNGSDFTIPRNDGIQGVNFAFIGRPAQYHDAASTPENLDPGSVQHIGAQALAITDALVRAPRLPAAGADLVYADLLGLVFIAHPYWVGWLLLGAAVGLAAFAAWRARRSGRLGLVEAGRGVLWAVWLIAAGVLLSSAARALAGPGVSRGMSPELYYTLLRRLPWMETGVGLVLLAAALVLFAGGLGRRWGLPALLVAATAAAAVLSGPDPVVLIAGLIAAGLAFALDGRPVGSWGGWVGLMAVVLVIAGAAQAAAPATAWLFVWPLLLTAATAAVVAVVEPGLKRPGAVALLVLSAVVGVSVLFSLAHPVFLGVGMDLPWAMAVLALLVVMLLRPLVRPDPAAARLLVAVAGVALLLGLATAGASRLIEPPSHEERAS